MPRAATREGNCSFSCECVEGLHSLNLRVVQQVGIDHGVLQVAVAEDLLQGEDVFAMPVEDGGEGVPGSLAGYLLLDAGFLRNLLQVLVDFLVRGQSVEEQTLVAPLTIELENLLGERRQRHRHVLSRLPALVVKLAHPELLDAQILGIAHMGEVDAMNRKKRSTF